MSIFPAHKGFMALDTVSIKPVNMALVKFTDPDIVTFQVFYNAVMAFSTNPSLNKSSLHPGMAV